MLDPQHREDRDHVLFTFPSGSSIKLGTLYDSWQYLRYHSKPSSNVTSSKKLFFVSPGVPTTPPWGSRGPRNLY